MEIKKSYLQCVCCNVFSMKVRNFTVAALCSLFWIPAALVIPIATSQAVIDSVIFNPTGLSLAPAQDVISFQPGSPPSGVRISSSAFSRFDLRDSSTNGQQFLGSDTASAPGIVFVPTAIEGALPHAKGIASTTSTPTLRGSAMAFADPSSLSGNFALAEAFQNVRFIALASGTLFASANFTFDQELSVDTAGGRATTTSDVTLELVRFGLPTFSEVILTDTENFRNVLSSPGSLNFERNGSLAVSRFFNAGDKGAFRAFVTNTASASIVPEPSIFLLIGSGLAGIVAWSWRKVARAKIQDNTDNHTSTVRSWPHLLYQY